MAKAKISWAIRHYSKEITSMASIDAAEFHPFLEVYYPTREKMRKAYADMPSFYKVPGSFFKLERLRVTDYEHIGKRSYDRVR